MTLVPPSVSSLAVDPLTPGDREDEPFPEEDGAFLGEEFEVDVPVKVEAVEMEEAVPVAPVKAELPVKVEVTVFPLVSLLPR
jgi:hypothetical protein